MPPQGGTVTEPTPLSIGAPGDLDLVAAYLGGEAAAFDTLFRRYHGQVRAVCLRYFGEETVADDLVQETFYNVIRSLSRVDEGFNFGGWVHRIAVNVCQDEARRRKRRALHALPGEGDPETAILKLPDGDRSGQPEPALEMKNLRQLVWEVAKRLPERQRMVLALRELQGLSYTSIARVMGISDAAVETLLHRARKRFRAEYLLLESPPEEPAACAGFAFVMSRGALSAADQRAAMEHLETCEVCSRSKAPADVEVGAEQAVAV